MKPSAASIDSFIIRIKSVGLEPKESTRGWHHIGAIICDAALQRHASTNPPCCQGYSG